MKYSQDEFLELMERVEYQGGSFLDDVHEKRVVRIPKQAEKGRRSTIELGCGHQSLFEIPYELENPGPAGELGIIRVCAVEDDVGKWPRFQKEPEDGS